jgi:deoxyribonuclease V
VEWPADAESLIAEQRRLARAEPDTWPRPDDPILIGASWVCFRRGAAGPGGAGDPTWTAAITMRGPLVVDQRVEAGTTDAPYVPGLLAMRTGRVLEATTRGLPTPPDVLIVDATARDHPRRAGLALHLGAALDLPSIGVTHRPLVAEGGWPADERGATSPLLIGGEVVAAWVRTRAGTRPLAVHPGWRVSLDDAVGVVLEVSRRHRTPEPLRRARQVARLARAGSGLER